MTIYNAKKIITCPDTGEVVSGDRYLSSIHWKQLRYQVYNYYEGKCQRCGDDIPVAVASIHHRIYKRLGKEKITDLVLLCSHCHACVHRGRKDVHKLNGNLNQLISRLSQKEKEEAFELLIKHFDLDFEYDENNRIKPPPKQLMKSQKRRQKKKNRIQHNSSDSHQREKTDLQQMVSDILKSELDHQQ